MNYNFIKSNLNLNRNRNLNFNRNPFEINCLPFFSKFQYTESN